MFTELSSTSMTLDVQRRRTELDELQAELEQWSRPQAPTKRITFAGKKRLEQPPTTGGQRRLLTFSSTQMPLDNVAASR